jgi:hypothetical protein
MIKDKNFNYGDTAFYLTYRNTIIEAIFGEYWDDGFSYVTIKGINQQVNHDRLFKTEDEAFEFFIESVKENKRTMISLIERWKKDIEKCDEILKNAKTKSYIKNER